MGSEDEQTRPHSTHKGSGTLVRDQHRQQPEGEGRTPPDPWVHPGLGQCAPCPTGVSQGPSWRQGGWSGLGWEAVLFQGGGRHWACA